MVPKSGHVTIMKIEKLHIDTLEKFTYSKDGILFDLWRKITKLSRKNRFRTVASPGACGRLTVLIDARRQYMFLVIIIIIIIKLHYQYCRNSIHYTSFAM